MTIPKREKAADIDAAAADWATRAEDSSFGEDQQRDLNAWLAADVRHLGAFARAQAILDHAARARALGPKYNPQDFLAPEDHGAGPSPHIWTRRRVVAAGAGGIAAAVAAGLMISMQAAARTFHTERGEVRLIPLEDGSSVTLNTDSKISVLFGQARRDITVLAGEVLFDVASDPARPFVVSAGDARLLTDRTCFTVRCIAQRPVEVLVRRGSVAISRKTGASASLLRVDANENASIPATGAITTHMIAPEEMDRQLAWQEGMLSFDAVSLQEAANEFARYSDQHIYFADSSVAAETVTGRYAANNPREFAQNAALSLGLQIELRPDGVLLRR